MNILIPIGGIGQRFKSEGYSSPKPLIKIMGTPMIQKVIESVNVDNNDTFHIIFSPELNSWNFRESILKEFPKLNFRFVELEKQTRGAAETIFLGLKDLESGFLDESFLILDCDTFYGDDVVGIFKELTGQNAIFYFDDLDDKPIFSYIKFDEEGKIFEIKEKIKISNHANTGAYGFRSGRILRDYCKSILDLDGELYVSRVYEKMIGDGEVILAKKITDFDCVGTPLQLRVYCERNRPKRKTRICFDLDNTLVSFPVIANDYTSVQPLQKNIDYLRFLKSQGAYIIIYTARRMKTHKGNVGAIVADVGKLTMETLERFGIPFDELHFGKPHADFYVDDLAVNAFSPLDKELGFYKTQSEARSFNKVEFEGEFVVKHTANQGEVYWYKNLPQSLQSFCPSLIESDLESGYLKIERIKGVNFSYLYTNNALQIQDLHLLLDSLNSFHQECPQRFDLDLSNNYSKKIAERYYNNQEIYSRIPESLEIFNRLLTRMKHYEKSGSISPCLIHGDPVFSNVIMTDRGLKFVDPRGKIGDTLTLYGDKNYDLAKVYQSIIGYDHILNDVEISYDYRERMKDAFEGRFSEDILSSVRLITAGLLFSLLPLHTFSLKKFQKYLSLTETLLR